MDRCVGAAARPPESVRKDLAIQALAGSGTVSDLAARHGVSRKFVYQQTHKARAALDDAFLSATPDHEVLFEVAVTKAWLRQVIVGLTLICRSSYRGVVEFLRDLLGLSISVGTVHHVLQSATRQAGVINHDEDLSGIRVGLHNEIFQGATPVLAGVDAASTYCYLLAGNCSGPHHWRTGAAAGLRASAMAWKAEVVLRRPVAITELAAAQSLVPHRERKQPVTLRKMTDGLKARSQPLLVGGTSRRVTNTKRSDLQRLMARTSLRPAGVGGGVARSLPRR